MIRLFVGLEVPESAATVLTMLRGGLSGARWIDPENYHVTLRFVGDVDDHVAYDLADMLTRVRRSAFVASFEGLGSFGGARPHTLHAALTTVPPLIELQAELERLCRRLGLEPDSRKFAPHVTLARLGRDASARGVASYLATRGGARPLPFEVRRFVLYSAKGMTGGGPYVVEETYPLR